MPGKCPRLHLVVALAFVPALLLGAATAAQDSATPVAENGASAIVPRPAHIHTGSCGDLGDVVYPLSDVPTVAVQTLPPLTSVGQSTTIVPAALGDLLASEHAVNAHASAEAIEDSIACGEITGTVTAGQVSIPLGGLNGSGFTGEAVLIDGGDGTTTVTVVLVGTGDPSPGAVAAAVAAAGATPAAAELPAGTAVATTSENVRVRAEPTTNADILASLGTGTQMEVTGSPEQAGGFLWYPVTVIVEDEEVAGWVAADFVAPVEGGG